MKREKEKMDTVAVAQRYMRGDFSRASSRRTAQRDEVMRFIFSKPGFAKVIAEHVGLTVQAVGAWDRVPAKYVRQLSPLVRMTPKRIRPDVFGDPK